MRRVSVIHESWNRQETDDINQQQFLYTEKSALKPVMQQRGCIVTARRTIAQDNAPVGQMYLGAGRIAIDEIGCLSLVDAAHCQGLGSVCADQLQAIIYAFSKGVKPAFGGAS